MKFCCMSVLLAGLVLVGCSRKDAESSTARQARDALATVPRAVPAHGYTGSQAVLMSDQPLSAAAMREGNVELVGVLNRMEQLSAEPDGDQFKFTYVVHYTVEEVRKGGWMGDEVSFTCVQALPKPGTPGASTLPEWPFKKGMRMLIKLSARPNGAEVVGYQPVE
jgi:hypothetical protein